MKYGEKYEFLLAIQPPKYLHCLFCLSAEQIFRVSHHVCFLYFHLHYMIVLCDFYAEDMNKCLVTIERALMTDQRNDSTQV